MNSDLIKRLGVSAHSSALAEYRLRMQTEFAGDVIFADIYDRKFSEKIVDICIDLVEDSVDHREPASTYGDKIRDYFGIEYERED
jgi:hypothetical protein